MSRFQDKKPGDRIGDWELLDRIGEGGGGHVWRVDGPGGVAALKVISPDIAEHEEVRARFLREVKTIRRVVHPHVVRYLDAGDVDGELFLVMEILEGEPLEDRLATVGRMTPEQVVRLGCELADGLAAVHAAGIVHRDMKPTNVLLCEGDVAKLIDFGIAKWTDAHMDMTQMTRTGRIMGTPNYMAPEQATAMRDESERTDVWGLAATLYDALVGHPPFGADDPPMMALLGRILTDDPHPMPDEVPDALEAVIRQGLQRDPDHRFQTMVAFSHALAAAVDVAPSVGRHEERRLVSLVWMRAASVQMASRAMREVLREGGDSYLHPRHRILGIFGGRGWLGDEPERATRAAYASRAFIEAGAVATGRTMWPPVRGAVSGEVMDTARVALDATAKGVVVCADTRERVGGLFDVDASGLVRERTQAGRSGGRSVRGEHVPLLARKGEMREIASALTMAIGVGRAAAVVIEGPPGMGKSRMLFEIVAWAQSRLHGCRFVEARAEPTRQLSSWALTRSVLRGAVPHVPADATLAAHADALLESAGLAGNVALRTDVGEVLGEGRDDAELRAVRQDGHAMGARLQDAVTALFASWCAAHPVVVLIDDIQLADDASINMLDVLLERLATAPLVVVGTSRARLEEWTRRRPRLAGATRVQLTALDPASVAKMTTVLLGDVGASTVASIVDRAQGNPHFVEELALATRDGMDVSALPKSMESSLQARVDALPPPEREVLEAAAIFGHTFWVEALVAMGTDDAFDNLLRLARRGLVTPEPGMTIQGGGGWSFCHEPVIRVAQSALSDARRQQLHRLAAAWLVAQPSPVPALVAWHLACAGDTRAAADKWLEVAEIALARRDHDGVLGATDHALATSLPASVEMPLRVCRAEALLAGGRAEAFEAELARLQTLDAQPGVEGTQRVQFRLLCALQLASHDTARAVQVLSDAVAMADTTADVPLRVRARCKLATLLSRVDVRQADSVLGQAEALVDARSDALVHALVYAARAMVSNYRGDIMGALDAWGAQIAALQSARVADGRLTRALLNRGYALRTFGAYAAAAEALETALSTAIAGRDAFVAAWARHNLGLVVARMGDAERGSALQLEAEHFGLDSGNAELTIAARLYGGIIANLAGDPYLGLEKLDMALAEARALERTTVQASCHIHRAIAFLALGQHALALGESASALAIRESAGGIPEFELELWLAHHDALSALGRPTEAHNARQRAHHFCSEQRATITDADLLCFYDAQPTVQRALGMG